MSAAVRERDNEQMTELPPPTGAPVGGSPGPAGKGSWWDSLPFDDPKEAAIWWYGPLAERQTWINVGYLFTGLLLGPIWFALVVVMLAVSLPLVLVAVGIPLLVLAFAVIDKVAELERRRAEWIGPPIPPRQLATTSGGWVRKLTTRLSDPARWRQAAYLLTLLVAGPVFYFLGAFPLNVVAQVLFGDSVWGAGIGLGGLIVAAVFAGAVSRVAAFAVRLVHSYVAFFLGPDRTEELEARVETLSGQRQDILDAVSAERRRIERNLHDGVQQQLVALGIDIGRASARVEDDPDGAKQLLDAARDKVRGAVGELRAIGRGLHPAVLDDRGLDAALSAVVSGAPIPIEVTVEEVSAVSTDVAETAYYVANEAVANVLKHSKARVASIRVAAVRTATGAEVLRLVVHDDGRGGATLDGGGTGLAGMAARVRAMDGTFALDSPSGGPTTLRVDIPLR